MAMFICPVCSEKYKVFPSLKAHFRKEHREFFGRKCVLCGRVVLKDEYIITHYLSSLRRIAKGNVVTKDDYTHALLYVLCSSSRRSKNEVMREAYEKILDSLRVDSCGTKEKDWGKNEGFECEA
ncbi:MAG: hypothetical protein QXN34_06970 [Archaeoglobaceae archaeon]